MKNGDLGVVRLHMIEVNRPLPAFSSRCNNYSCRFLTFKFVIVYSSVQDCLHLVSTTSCGYETKVLKVFIVS